jgi:hypothetical protein
LAHFQKLAGTITRIEPSRTFIDGVYYRIIEFTSLAGTTCNVRNVFVTVKLCSLLKANASGVFYFWNSHCYAFHNDKVIEDIEGARASYFQRDARLLLLMAISIILLPVVVFVAAKKLLLGGSERQMRAFLYN